MDNAEFKSKVLNALKWVASMRLLGQVFSWLATLVVIRLLAPEDYGVLALAQLLVGLATLLNEIGLTPALIQARTAPESIVRSVFGFVLLSNCVLYTIVYAAAPAFAGLYDVAELTDVVRVLGLQLFIGALGAVPTALAKRDMAFKSISLIGLAATVAGSIASLSVALLDGGVWALVAANLVMATVQSAGIIVATRFRMAPSMRLTGMRRLASFGAWVSGSRLAWYFAQSADDLLIGKAFGNQVLGSYSVAKNLAAIPMHRVMEIVNQLTFPAYARLDGDANKALQYFLTSVWLAMLIFCPVTWGLSSVADLFTVVVLGDKWTGAAFPLRIIALSIPIQALSFLLTPAVEALGRPDLGFRNSIVRLIVFPLSIVLAIPLGIDAVVVSFVVGRAITLLMFINIAGAVFPLTMTDVWLAARAPVAAGTTMYLVVTLVIRVGTAVPEPTVLLGFAILAGAVAYCAALLLLAPATIRNLKSTFNIR